MARVPTVLITGTKSGLGLEFARRFAQREWDVIATHYSADPPELVAESMARYPSIRYHRVDVGDPASIRAAAAELADQPIDVLINNAAIAYDASPTGTELQSFGTLDADQFHRAFGVNVLGSLLMAQEFLPHVRAGEHKKIVSISSATGSLTAPLLGGPIYYKATKAALNRAMINIAEQLRPEGIIVSLIHPGSVTTEKNVSRGRSDYPGLIDTEFSVNGMMNVIDQLTIANTGRFYNYDLGYTPW